MNRVRQADASHRVEELTLQLEQLAALLREGVDDELAHALVYHVRHQLGKVTASLGGGLPRRSVYHQAIELLAPAGRHEEPS